MAGVLDGVDVKATKLSYKGPFGVGYGIASFHPTGVNEDRKLLEKIINEKKKRLKERKDKEDSFVRLARKSFESYVLTGTKIEVSEDLEEEFLRKRAGCFVSLKKEGTLRGCIGTIAPTKTRGT